MLKWFILFGILLTLAMATAKALTDHDDAILHNTDDDEYGWRDK